ncbi:response regulator [Neptunitalea lumnitzerae]|uniref:Response regulator n=1 Tax=Neptunitalea lumnitzerae TaxID=2965509 RepID=A0ABQ5MGD6_9FLAO|nr:response regulator [Neptunitalea sp. Y10]GLB48463.1 response regulator [Neptunitalea sp. Y10]
MKKINLACIIDDDPIFVFGTKRLMELVGFCDDVVVYHNGQEAIDGFAKRINDGLAIPEIIMLDLNMPILDGWCFLDRLNNLELPKFITIYLVSSSIDPADMKRSENYSMITNYIVKPITTDKLMELLEAFQGG